MTNEQALKAAQAIFGNLVIDVVGDYNEPEGHGCGVDLITDSRDIADDHGITLMFENGNRVRFSTSEWAYIQRLP